MANYREIFRSTGLLGSVQAIQVLLAVIRNKVTAVLIGAAGMGLAELYFRTLEMIGNVTNFGLPISAIKHLSLVFKEEEERRTTDGTKEKPTKRLIAQVRLIRTLVFMTSLLGAAVCIGLSPLISRLTSGDYARTWEFCLLAPAVAFTTLASGEAAILKATRRLRRLALSSVLAALLGVISVTVCYYFGGMSGIIPALLLLAFTMWACYFYAVCRDFSYVLGLGRRSFIRRGLPLVRLGSAYILSGFMLSGVELFIRAYLGSTPGGLMLVGLYSAGFTLTISYERLLFVSMDGDFLPRLSACGREQGAMNLTVNRQINTLAVFIVPALLLFSLLLPFIIRLIYTEEFLAIESMVRLAICSMYFKAIYAPLAYIPLARGAGRYYLLTEGISDILLLGGVIGGYSLFGLAGTGAGLALAHALHVLLYFVLYRARFGVRLYAGTLRRAFFLFLILSLGLLSALFVERWLAVSGHIVALFLALPVVLPILKKVKRR